MYINSVCYMYMVLDGLELGSTYTDITKPTVFMKDTSPVFYITNDYTSIAVHWRGYRTRFLAVG